jgi:uncharacterized LabA/DUF88 family protein
LNTIVFIDGQNLYRTAKDAWCPGPNITLKHTDTGYKYIWPSYDVEKLATALVSMVSGRVLSQIRFYTGVPRPDQNAYWHSFWERKLKYLMSQGVQVYKGRINEGQQEKGVDVSIAVDLIRYTYEKSYDVAIIVSQDWDFGPAIWLAKQIAKDQNRNLVFESHFPYGQGSKSTRGIPGTNWKLIDQAVYDSCFCTRDYGNPTP